jgi:hypothetical protein
MQCGRSGGRTPRTPIVLHNNHKPIKGCHVAAHDWTTWHLTISQRNAMCHHLIQQLSTNKKFPRHFCTVVRFCHVSLYGLYSQHHFFCLFDFMNRLQYLSLPMSILDETSCVGFATMRPTLSSGLK